MNPSEKTPLFHHALRFREDMCIGCSHCMNVCPTEAIRVTKGKARLLENHCIDCGVCFRVCPAGAIIVEQDDLDTLDRFAVRVALVPAVFTGQFPESAGTRQILEALQKTGFTHVVEVEEGVALLEGVVREYIANHPENRPLISSFCPAIVRLVQVKFPTLTGHIVRLKAPVDIAAINVRQSLVKEGVPPGEIGIFYITPCAAKIVAIKDPVGEKGSGIDGVINMNFIYNKVFKQLRADKSQSPDAGRMPLSGPAVKWSLTGGESAFFHDARTLAIDEINNVIEFLEKVENEEIDGIDFLELRACDESCAGGILCPGNRFLTAERLKRRSRQALTEAGSKGCNLFPGTGEALASSSYELGPIQPRSILKLDDEVTEAITKMKRIYELNKGLPQVDCGICGSPTCRALSEDIVQRGADIRQCIFIQRVLEQNGSMEPDDSLNLMKLVWGERNLDKNILKETPGETGKNL